MNYDSSSKIKVAVIGAGVAGLCAMKHLSCEPDTFEVVAYEQGDDIGGTWRYTKEVGVNKYGLPVHSSMYENLRTNIPKEIMEFPDFPFPDYGGKSFLHHSAVLKYLEDYATKYDLLKYIKFQSIVKVVQPITPSSTNPKWNVCVQNVRSGAEMTGVHDSVMVCNGRYSVPRIPVIDGTEKYEGILMHSHDYRDNSQFSNLKVVVLGAGPSGIDIAIEVSATAKEVVLSHNLPLKTCAMPRNITQKLGISRIDKKSVILLDQEIYSCDAILLCTGYQCSYPFLQDCHIQVDDGYVYPLFEQLFHAEYPTLGIWGSLRGLVSFKIYDQQCLVFLKYLKGDIKLPSFEDKMKDAKCSHGRYLKLCSENDARIAEFIFECEYDNQLSILGKIPPIPNAIRKIKERVVYAREQNILNFRNMTYKILDEDNFIETEN